MIRLPEVHEHERVRRVMTQRGGRDVLTKRKSEKYESTLGPMLSFFFSAVQFPMIPHSRKFFSAAVAGTGLNAAVCERRG